MSQLSDPIADFLTRLRNAGSAHQAQVIAPYSKIKAEIARILQDEGYIQGFRVLDEAAEKSLPLHEIEKEYIKKILDKTGGNKYQAAHALGIDRKTLYRKLAEIEGKPHPEE